jgi:hypothetical protein
MNIYYSYTKHSIDWIVCSAIGTINKPIERAARAGFPDLLFGCLGVHIHLLFLFAGFFHERLKACMQENAKAVVMEIKPCYGFMLFSGCPILYGAPLHCVYVQAARQYEK